VLPIITALRNEKLSDSHFNEINKLVKQKLKTEDMILKDFLHKNIVEASSQIISISNQVT